MNKKMRACKSCGEQIAKSAKHCPHCGAKKKRGWLFKILAIWFVLTAGFAILKGGDEKVVLIGGQKIENADPKIISTNETITYDNIEVAVESLEIKKSFSDNTGILTATAQNGATLVAIVVRYKNVGKDAVNPFSLPQFKLVSPDGVEIEFDLGKSAALAGIKNIDSKVLSDISPGLRSQDTYVFEVDEGDLASKGWKFKVGAIRKVFYKVNYGFSWSVLEVI